jgi:hypothetical protein
MSVCSAVSNVSAFCLLLPLPPLLLLLLLTAEPPPPP